MMADGELHELALAAEGSRAEIMVEIDYKSDQVTEIAPTMSYLANALCGTVNLTGSGTIVLGNAGAPPVTACP